MACAGRCKTRVVAPGSLMIRNGSMRSSRFLFFLRARCSSGTLFLTCTMCSAHLHLPSPSSYGVPVLEVGRSASLLQNPQPDDDFRHGLGPSPRRVKSWETVNLWFQPPEMTQTRKATICSTRIHSRRRLEGEIPSTVDGIHESKSEQSRVPRLSNSIVPKRVTGVPRLCDNGLYGGRSGTSITHFAFRKPNLEFGHCLGEMKL
jgi:hypothetical protein